MNGQFLGMLGSMGGAVAALHIAATCLAVQSDPQEGNLNRINRVKPSATAARIGTGVLWEETWDKAAEKSRTTGKPIFWYIATIPGTFMDRKTEIDRYMLAGPFSWPATLERLNRDFVPVRCGPSPEQIEAFGLKPYKFVEPGFLIIGADHAVKLRVDHLTTLHPLWLDHLIGSAAESTPESATKPEPSRAELVVAWRRFSSGEFDLALDLSADRDRADPLSLERLLLAGMAEFRRGDHESAKAYWRRAAAAQPDAPLAWKAAAEAEGFGPFVRGFEVFADLPEAAYRAGLESIGSAAPEKTYAEADLWNRGVDFLLGMQAASGGYFDSDYDFGGFDSLPNVHVAVTSLVGLALCDACERVEPSRQPRVREALARAAEFVADEQNINVRDKDEILWAQAYRVRLLARLVKAKWGDTHRYQTALDRAVKGLERIQLDTGGWYHEYANPFVTATALTALHNAQTAGASIDTEKVARGLASLAGDRAADGAYPYQSARQVRRKSSSIAASAGRIPVGDMALWQWGKLTDAQLTQAARTALEHHPSLDAAYKYDNHTSTMGYGGFFFWYDMHARSELIARIGDPAERRELQDRQRGLILKLPEIDGCFVDSHELGRCYGTAMALLSLAQLE
jgi:hypothetical protein